MIYVLYANALFLCAFGLVMILSPGLVLKECTGLAASQSRAFGFAEFAVGGLSLAMAVRHETAFFSGLLTLALFHVGLTVALTLSFLKKFNPIPPVLIHGIFAVIFVLGTIGSI